MVALETLAGVLFTILFLWCVSYIVFITKDLRQLAVIGAVLFVVLFASAFWINAAGFSGANLHPLPPPIPTEAPRL